MAVNKINNFPELQELKKLSSSMGKDRNLIQGSGGNTSIKIEDKLFVKASGTMLKDALNKEIFVPIKLKSIFSQLNIAGKLEKDLEIKPLSNSHLKPSIETAFHAFMPHKVVLHSHAIDVIVFTISPLLKNNLKYILKNYSWKFINYARPGYPLANLMIEALSKKKIDIFILENHGLIIGADTVMKAKELQDKIISLLKIRQRNFIKPDLSILNRISLKIPNSKLPISNIIHSLAIDNWSFELAKKNPLYPDHIIFCGKKILILDHANLNLEELTNFDYFLLPNFGVLILKEKSKVLEIMLEMQAQILLKINFGTEISCLSESQCNELLDWEAEKYRKNLIKN